jgi:diacylglycerol O-acyltransferase / wax synthase
VTLHEDRELPDEIADADADPPQPSVATALPDADPAEASVRFEDRMSDADALMWAIEKDPMLRSTITTAVVLDGEVDRARLHRVFERASRVVPRLRQRVRSNPLSIAPPRWEGDPNFDLRYHLRSARATGTGSMRDLLDMCSPIAMQGFDRARPLWEATVVEGLAGNRTGIILKIHHAITDGIGGVQLMLELFDLAADTPDRPMPPEPPVHVLNQTERFIDAFQHEQRRQLGLARRATTAGIDGVRNAVADPTGSLIASSELASSVSRILRPVSTPLSPLMRERSLSNHLDVLSMPLDVAKKVGKRIGGSLNDTFVTGVARGMHLYHRHHGVDPTELRMGMPISTRTSTTEHTAGNSFVPARIEIPVFHDDPVDMMEAIREKVVAARDEPANQLVEPVSNVLNRLPTSVLTQLFGTMMKGLDFQTSNVPGAPIPLFLVGTPVAAIFPFGPLAGAAVNVTLLSYQNELNTGVNVDPAAIPDVDVFMEFLHMAYDDLLDLV